MRRSLRTCILILVAVFASACINDVPIEIPEDCTGIEWHYEGQGGVDDWQNLCLGFAECGGRSQSPINIIQPSASAGPSSLSFNYGNSITDIVNNGHTIQFNYSLGSSMQWRAESWQLLQFHLHTASEHTIDGESYPMEMHFVHRNQAGELAVVGLLFESGQESEFLSQFISILPTSKGQAVQNPATYNATHVLPTTLSHYQYDGSLTTPPCTQGVNWIVLQQKMTASATQLTLLKAIMHHNNRPVQPLHDRLVKRFD